MSKESPVDSLADITRRRFLSALLLNDNWQWLYSNNDSLTLLNKLIYFNIVTIIIIHGKMFGDAAVAAAQIGCDKILRVHMFNVSYFFIFFFNLLLFLEYLSKSHGVEPQHKKSFMNHQRKAWKSPKWWDKTRRRWRRRRGVREEREWWWYAEFTVSVYVWVNCPHRTAFSLSYFRLLHRHLRGLQPSVLSPNIIVVNRDTHICYISHHCTSRFA